MGIKIETLMIGSSMAMIYTSGLSSAAAAA